MSVSDAVGSSRMRTRASVGEGPGEGDHGLLHRREVAGELAQRDLLVQPVELLPRPTTQRPPVDDADAAGHLLTEQDVLGHAEWSG